MAVISFTLNGQTQTVDAVPDMPLLWLLRDTLALTGTKYGCGIAQCGACTVHLDGAPVRSCVIPIAGIEGKNITTIEGLSTLVSQSVYRYRPEDFAASQL
jgi:aerobic-type carbon monoxide dehydrogenase small subunit (CoxS/CutS family)